MCNLEVRGNTFKESFESFSRRFLRELQKKEAIASKRLAVQ
jgi:hypothetical protein